jgi:hypothetical protein
MDRERFDALSRMVAQEQSRRAVFAALLSFAALGRGARVHANPGTAGGAGLSKRCHALQCGNPKLYPVPKGADPEFCCNGGFCSCGGECCANACFQTGDPRSPNAVFCCTRPDRAICGPRGEETCCERSCDACGELGETGLAGSYRRH